MTHRLVIHCLLAGTKCLALEFPNSRVPSTFVNFGFYALKFSNSRMPSKQLVKSGVMGYVFAVTLPPVTAVKMEG